MVQDVPKILIFFLPRVTYTILLKANWLLEDLFYGNQLI